MAIVVTPKFGLKQYTSGSDPHPTREEFNAMIAALEDWGATSQKNTAANRPTAGQEGRFFWATDQQRIYYDDGVVWRELTSNGGGGPATVIMVGATGAAEGTSERSARADHVHTIPLASSTVNGAMGTLDKQKLDNAASAATALRLVIRDANGRAQFGDPAAAADASTKGYVDQQVATRALASHTHSYADLTDAPTSNAPVAWNDVLNKPATFPPTIGTTAATAKPGSYVPSWAEITGKPATFAPSGHTHLWADLTDKPATFPPVIGTTVTTAKAGNWVPAWGDVTGKPVFFNADWPTTISNKPTTFPPVIGTTASTAKAGNWVPAWGEITGKPTNFEPVIHRHYVEDIIGQPGFVSQRTFNDFMSTENTRQQNDINYVNSRVDSTWNFAAGKLGQGDHGIYHDDSGISSWRTFNVSAAYNGQFRSMWVHQDGRYGVNLSSRKYKANERDYVVPLETLKNLSPKWFQYKADIEGVGEKDAMWRANFIAEDLFDHDLKEFVSFDGEGTARENCHSINESFLVTTLWSFCQQQQELIEGLQKQIDALGGAA